MQKIINNRPIAFCAFFLVMGITAAYYLNFVGFLPLILTVISGLMFLFLLIKGNSKAFFALYLLFFFLGSFLFGIQYHTDYSGIDTNQKYDVSARVANRERMAQKTHKYTLKEVELSADGSTIPFSKSILLYSTDVLDYGDKIEFKTKLELPSTPKNPGAFDNKMYLAANGAGLSCYSRDIRYMGNEWGVYKVALFAREYLSQRIDDIYTEETAPIAKAMFLGVKDEIPDELREEFSKTGIAHVLAISGLHITVIATALNMLLKKSKLKRDHRFLLQIVLLICYMFVTAFAASVVRAVIMACFMLFAQWKFLKRDTLTAFCAALLFILILSPAQLFTAGFLMSFGVVFGLLCLMPALDRLFTRIRFQNTFSSMLSASCVASIAVLPLTAYYFSQIVWIAPLANFYAIPLATGIVVFTALSSLVSILWIPAAKMIALLSQVFITLLVYSNQTLAGSGFGFVEVEHFPISAGVILFVILFLLSDYIFLKIKWKAILSTILTMLMIALVSIANYTAPNMIKVNVLDVGTGDAIHIQLGDKDVLIDNGGNMQRSKLVEYTEKNKLCYDIVFITNDRSNNLKELVLANQIKTLYVAPNYVAKAWDENLDRKTYQKYDKIELDATTELRCVAQDSKHSSFVLTVSGEDLCLFAQNTADQLVQMDLRVPLVKLANGGGKNSLSQELIDTTGTKDVVISVKEGNSKGLPNQQVLDILIENEVAVWSTAKSGAIIIEINGNNELSVSSMK